jgi:putative addiction module component (TIGR02574 family)
MSMSFEHIKAEAAKLSEVERAELAHEMLKSLDAADDADLEEIEQAWIREAERRSAEIARGEAKLIPGDEVFARLNERFK